MLNIQMVSYCYSRITIKNNDGDSDTSSDTESEESEEDSDSSVDLDPTFSGKRFQSKSIDQTTHTPSKQLAHAATMVTLPVSIISDLTKNANLANAQWARGWTKIKK